MMRRGTRAGELRVAIERLPLATRQAMLRGIERKPIIAGADGDPRGGVCPVYAIPSPPSKRIGQPFARAWDRYAGARFARPASERELRTLHSMLETSIELEAEPVVSFDDAIASHRASQARGRAVPSVRRDTGERDRTGELSRRHGWAWLRPFRRYDEYEQALRALDLLAGEVGSEPAQDVGSEQEPGRLVGSSYGRG